MARMVTLFVTACIQDQSAVKGYNQLKRTLWEMEQLHHSESSGGGDQQWLTPSQDFWWDTNNQSKVGRCGGQVPGPH